MVKTAFILVLVTLALAVFCAVIILVAKELRDNPMSF